MDSYRLETAFFPGSQGALHLSLFLPLHTPASVWVIHFPAFAEEMNKSRAMVASVARHLAERGVAVVIPDLFGTGDSEGEFVEARWEVWLADQAALACWVREQQGARRLVFWGHRLGAILAAEVAASMEKPPEELVFWQPIHSGKQQMTQFLRVRMAASLAREGVARENVTDLRATLLEGNSLRVAGYQLASDLFCAIDNRQLSDIEFLNSVPLSIFEVGGSGDGSGTPVTRKQVELWQEKGLSCCLKAVRGDPFWATQELGWAPDLVTLTVEHITGSAQKVPPAASIAAAVQPDLSTLAKASRDGTSGLVFRCADAQLAGVLHTSDNDQPDTAVLIVVGGPQYRIGSHRQFVYLARSLATAGLPVLRFDYRGMGDSGGEFVGFRGIEQDICNAIDALTERLPSLNKIILWGLCDAATAAVAYAPSDRRVGGLVLANPWVYSEQGAAKTYLKHYYVRRFLSKGFWRKLFSGAFQPGKSMASLVRFGKQAMAPVKEASTSGDSVEDKSDDVDLVSVFAGSLAMYKGPVLLVLSGNDLTAAEFVSAGQSHTGLRRALSKSRIEQMRMPGVDHTFSRPEWRESVQDATLAFIRAQAKP